MINVIPNLGIMATFRNPAQWRRPFVDVYRDELDTIVEAERLGYESVWLSEHHFFDDGYSPALTTIAAAIAARTERIRIGFNILVLPYHNPVHLAEQIATLDVLSNGRIDIGVGLGQAANEYESLGIPMKERLQRYIEGLDILTGLLSNDTFSYEGKHYQVNNARLRPPAVQQPMPPLWMGAAAPVAVERAGKRGANYHGWAQAQLQAIYEQARAEAGFDVASAKTSLLMWMHTAETDDQAWREAGPHYHHVLTGYKAISSPGDMLYNTELPPPKDMQSNSASLPFRAAIGSPETVLAAIRKLIAPVRTTHLAMNTMAGMDPARTRRSLKLFAEKVAPALKQM